MRILDSRITRAFFLVAALIMVGTVSFGRGAAARADAPGCADGECDRVSFAAEPSAEFLAGAPALRRVVGYFPLWARNGGYTERDVDFSIVNHIAHFSVVPNSDGSIQVPDWGQFPDPALLNRAHENGAKVSIVVGGDHAEATRGFSVMAANTNTRARFIRDLMGLVTAHGYDGVDIDWEFPESVADRSNLTALVHELRAALGSGRTLSVAGPASDWYGRWFDLPALARDLDWIGAMTYSLNAPGWSRFAGHNAALYTTRQAAIHDGGELSLDTSRAYYLGRGVPASKLLLGLPFYGQRFDGAKDINQPLASSAGAALDYRDIASMVDKDGWIARTDRGAQVPYLVGNNGGVLSYDDPGSIAAKCNYTSAQGLGGVIIWHLGKDKVGSTQPLLSAVGSCR